MTAQAGMQCLYCGEVEHVALLEFWDDHTFMLEACCEQLEQEAREQIVAVGDGPLPPWLREAFEGGVGHAPKRLVEDDLQLRASFGLVVRAIPQALAKAFVARHHSHSPKPPAGWRFGAGVFCGPTLVGVAMAGRPVARLLDHRQIVEVNRLCVRRDRPTLQTRNVCSMLYAWCAREAARRGFSRIITYTTQSESGASVRAAGWMCDGRAGGGSWSRRERHRAASGNEGPKVRWSRLLAPSLAGRAPRHTVIARTSSEESLV